MAYFGANKSPQQPARLLLFNPKEGEREGKKKKPGEKKNKPGITMATCSSLVLQNLKVPTPHLSVVSDQAMMTVGITTCYACWMLMARGCASKQVAYLKHPPLGQPEPQVPPWAVLQWVAVWFWEAGLSPGHRTAIALPNPSVPDGLCRGMAPLGRRRSPPWQGLVQISRLQVCLLPRSPFPCSLLTHLLFKERPSVALSTTRIA